MEIKLKCIFSVFKKSLIFLQWWDYMTLVVRCHKRMTLRISVSSTMSQILKCLINELIHLNFLMLIKLSISDPAIGDENSSYSGKYLRKLYKFFLMISTFCCTGHMKSFKMYQWPILLKNNILELFTSWKIMHVFKLLLFKLFLTLDKCI